MRKSENQQNNEANGKQAATRREETLARRGEKTLATRGDNRNAPAETVVHQIEPVWNSESRVLLLGTMPSPASRNAGFFYMHPQNRFWKVLPAVFGETLSMQNSAIQGRDTARENDELLAGKRDSAIQERKDFLLRHNIALWDVLFSCGIRGAADATIKDAVPNDFSNIFEHSKIRRVFCTGKAAYGFWQKLCAKQYEEKFGIKCECLPSTSPANAAWSLPRLIDAYKKITEWL